MSALTPIIDNKTYQSSTQKRVRAYDPMTIMVGKNQLVGIPYLRNAHIKPIDVLVQETRVSDTPRLGETMLLPDRRLTSTMEGGSKKVTKKKVEKAIKSFIGDVKKEKKQSGKGIIGDVAKSIKVAAKEIDDYAKKTKFISTSLGIASPIAKYMGRPEMSLGLYVASTAARQMGYGPQAVGRVGNPMVMKGSGLQKDLETLSTETRGVRGNEKMSFVPTHPMNYKRATLI
tara:strand:+ start:1163 stop:1852 length:690 start_codon:yes stop_codon:yes gene_type:complete